jgi:hypothetical protein
MSDVRPTRVPKPDEVDGFNAYVDARVERAEHEAVLEATDPDEIEARRRERRLLQLLIVMVVAIVAAGFVISIVGLLLTGGGGGGR